MAKYKICRDCGAHLDPGELCDCRIENAPPVAAGEAFGVAFKELPPTENTSADSTVFPANCQTEVLA